MKQKLISKLKRVALAFFAALCVGSVWAEDLKAKQFFFPEPAITLSPTGEISVGGDIQVYTYQKVDVTCTVSLNYIIKSGDDVLKEDSIDLDSFKCTTSKKYYGRNKNTDGPYTYSIPDYDNYIGAQVTINVIYSLDKALYSAVGWSETSGKYKTNAPLRQSHTETAVFDTAGVMSTQATWSKGTSTFVVSGDVAGVEKVRIKYKLIDENTATPESADGFISIDRDVVDRTYSLDVDYGNTRDVSIVWTASALMEDGSEKAYEAGKIFRAEVVDVSRVTYTWKGGSEPAAWANVANWEATIDQCKGYPGKFGIKYNFSSVLFDSDADVNLGGGSYCLIDNAGSFTIASDKNVILRNGTIDFGNVAATLGASGSTLEFNNVNIKHGTSSNGPVLSFADGSTIVLSGTPSPNYWKYAMKGNNVNFTIRDGHIKSRYSSSEVDIKSTQTVLITNAVWEIISGTDQNSSSNNDRVNKGLAYVTEFRDGVGEDGRQAKFIQKSAGEGIALLYTYDIVIPEDIEGREATIQALKLDTQNPDSLTGSCTFRLDVSNYLKSDRVPLVSLTNSGQDDNMTTKLSNTKLEAIANEKDVTKDRNAKLEWDSSKKTLYYVQDEVVPPPQSVAMIEGTEKEYSTLADAIAEANGDTIKLLADIEAPTAFVIGGESGAKTVTIDLNGKTVKANDTDVATDGNGVFWVQAGGKLTLEDSSADKSGTVDGNGGNGYKMAIWADGGKVVINAGNYVNENDGTHTQYDLIYVKNKGSIEINGGTFKCDTPRWTLNSHNTKTGTFVVTGGKFYQYNPTDFDTDEAVTTWCDAKYRAEADGDWYVIKEGYTVTETSVATVPADTEADALAQVDFSVTTPEGVDAEKYNDYFKLVATETAEGSKTWTVALALKDDVKPVIAETTADDTTKEAFVIDDDGNVTLNISNKKPGLYYGVQVLAELGADPVAVVPETEAGALVVTADNIPDGNAAFFKVIVDFTPIVVPEAE